MITIIVAPRRQSYKRYLLTGGHSGERIPRQQLSNLYTVIRSELPTAT